MSIRDGQGHGAGEFEAVSMTQEQENTVFAIISEQIRHVMSFRRVSHRRERKLKVSTCGLKSCVLFHFENCDKPRSKLSALYGQSG